MVEGDLWGDYSLLLTLIVTVATQLLFFFIAYGCQFDKVTDFAGTANFVINAVVTLLVGNTFFTRQIVNTVFVSIWGVRLGSFLLSRVLTRGKDERFDDMRADFCRFFGFWVVQMIWVWLVSLPITFLNASSTDVSLQALDYVGWVLFGIGLITESVADYSKAAFYNSTETRGRLLNTGIWKYSRHPNYFGEILLWFGLFLSCAAVFDDNTKWGYVSIVSPLITFMLLVFVSGIPLAEDRYDKRFGRESYYHRYKNETSPLIPLPNGFYADLPPFIKKYVFLEFDRYSQVLRSLSVEEVGVA